MNHTYRGTDVRRLYRLLRANERYIDTGGPLPAQRCLRWARHIACVNRTLAMWDYGSGSTDFLVRHLRGYELKLHVEYDDDYAHLFDSTDEANAFFADGGVVLVVWVTASRDGFEGWSGALGGVMVPGSHDAEWYALEAAKEQGMVAEAIEDHHSVAEAEIKRVHKLAARYVTSF